MSAHDIRDADLDFNRVFEREPDEVVTDEAYRGLHRIPMLDLPIETEPAHFGSTWREPAPLRAPPSARSWRWARLVIATIGAALLFALLTPTAHAGAVGAHLVTRHFGAAADQFESVTPGIYLRMASGLTAGTYRNSERRASVYVGWTWETADKRFALTAGAVTGYDTPVAPLVVPSMRLTATHGLDVRLALIPKPIKHGGAAGLHLAVERSF